MRIVLLFLVSLTATSAFANETTQEDRLPEPLSLEAALTHIRLDHPLFESLRHNMKLADNNIDRARLGSSVNAWFKVDGRYADKAVSPGTDFVNDSRLRFYIGKLLTDFGHSKHALEAAEFHRDSVQIANDWKKSLHGMDVMHKFLQVHLSDLRYFADDELMTLSFFPYNRTLERMEKYEEFSLLTVKERETRFRRKLKTRAATANSQRLTRNRLALAMGRPGQLADQVYTPDLSMYDRPVPDYDEILAEVLEKHPLMRVNHLLTEAARARVGSAEKINRPRLSARFEAQEYERQSNSSNRDELLAGIELHLPLGGRQRRAVEVIKAESEYERLLSDRRQFEFELRQEVLELVMKLDELNFALQAAMVNSEYRQLYLDRSRNLYEMEVRADLGDSQARQAEAEWELKKVEYQRAVTWAKLDAMRGRQLAVLVKDNPNEDQ